ncbi:cobalamin/Fe(3+)-siderophore ABC transporter ATP-binding protein, partial [Lachnotalea glycerini]
MKQTPYFTASSLVAGYDKKIIVNNIDIIIPKNKIRVKNGAKAGGKTTHKKTRARKSK